MAGTFYQQIGANKRNSVLLALIVTVLLGALGLFIGWAVTGDPRAALPSLAIAIALGVVASLFSYYAGDSVVLGVSGAKEIDPQALPQLYNVVQEMAIAANVPMPKIYLIDDTAPNAFATGRDPQHASVAITTGLLQKLDREELQGVMAHELSHVRNFDIRFSLMVGVLVGSIALLADFFLRFTFWGGGRRSRSNNDSGGGGLQIVVFVVAIVLAILAPILARLVQLAISRQREYLADASGVELTRNPVGLEQALAKIAARPGAARGRQPGDPAPLLREPDQGRVGQAVEPVLDPPTRDGPDQSAAGAPGTARDRGPQSRPRPGVRRPDRLSEPVRPACAAARTLPPDPVAMAVGARPRTLR